MKRVRTDIDMNTNPSNDSGVETSNDSNDTTSMQSPPPAFNYAPAAGASSALAFPLDFNQRSHTQYTTRNALVLYGEGASGRRGMIVRPLHGSGSSGGNSGGSTSSDDAPNGSGISESTTSSNLFNILAAPSLQFYSSHSGDGHMDTGNSSTSSSSSSTNSSFISQQPSPALTTRIHTIRSRYSAERSARVFNDTCNVVSSLLRSSASSSATAAAAASSPAGTSAGTSCPTSPLSSHLGRHLELCVPLSFLTTFQPSYPASTTTTNTATVSTTTSTTRSPPDVANRLKAMRTSSVSSGLHRHQVPYILNMSNERKLRLAASLSNVEVLLRLLDAGVNANSSDEYQRSALHLAASRGYTDVVIQLLKYGAKPNAQDSLGNTPLHLAVCSASSFNFNRVVRLLLKSGASVQVQDNHGKTPLDLVKSKLRQMRLRRANDHSPEAIKMLFDLSVLTALLINTCVREIRSADDMNSLEERLQQLSTTEVECEADALLAKVEQLTLKS